MGGRCAGANVVNYSLIILTGASSLILAGRRNGARSRGEKPAAFFREANIREKRRPLFRTGKRPSENFASESFRGAVGRNSEEEDSASRFQPVFKKGRGSG